MLCNPRATNICCTDSQVFPYFYVPYTDDAPGDSAPGEINSLLRLAFAKRIKTCPGEALLNFQAPGSLAHARACGAKPIKFVYCSYACVQRL